MHINLKKIKIEKKLSSVNVAYARRAQIDFVTTDICIPLYSSVTCNKKYNLAG